MCSILFCFSSSSSTKSHTEHMEETLPLFSRLYPQQRVPKYPRHRSDNVHLCDFFLCVCVCMRSALKEEKKNNKFHEICTEGRGLEGRLIGAEHAATGSARTPSSSFPDSLVMLSPKPISFFSPFSSFS